MGPPNPGGGLAAQMATELVGCGDFLVVERANLDAVLAEQAIGAQQKTPGDAVAKVGDLLGVIEDKLGLVTVSAVQPRFCIAQLKGDFKPVRGDIARSVKT